MKSNWTFKREKRAACWLTEMSIHRVMSVERAVNKANHFQIHVFSRATTFDHNRLQLWPHSSASYNYSSCLPFTMSATCWSQTSLLLSQSQHNHQQLRKRKWLPSGQIRMCNTSYSNTRLSAPTPLPTHCNYTICLFYIMILHRCTQFILSSVKLNRGAACQVTFR